MRSDFVVNEGGGSLVEFGGRRIYTLSVGEKGIFRTRVNVSGQAGHAISPSAVVVEVKAIACELPAVRAVPASGADHP